MLNEIPGLGAAFHQSIALYMDTVKKHTFFVLLVGYSLLLLSQYIMAQLFFWAGPSRRSKKKKRPLNLHWDGAPIYLHRDDVTTSTG